MARQIATNRIVDRDELLAFLRPRHRVILSTTRADGMVQSSPVSAGIDSHGRLVVSTYPQRAKVLNLRRRPAVSACVLSDEWNGAWVQIDGIGEVLDLPEALEPLAALEEVKERLVEAGADIGEIQRLGPDWSLSADD